MKKSKATTEMGSEADQIRVAVESFEQDCRFFLKRIEKALGEAEALDDQTPMMASEIARLACGLASTYARLDAARMNLEVALEDEKEAAR